LRGEDPIKAVRTPQREVAELWLADLGGCGVVIAISGCWKMNVQHPLRRSSLEHLNQSNRDMLRKEMMRECESHDAVVEQREESSTDRRKTYLMNAICPPQARTHRPKTIPRDGLSLFDSTSGANTTAFLYLYR
jgi:hypothetical protein